MTEVFVTRTGAKYHADYSCSGILDAEANQGRAIERWRAPLHGLQLSPCLVCWPATRDWDAWTQLAHEIERKGDSPYEAHFVRQVLRHVRGIAPSDVTSQVPAEGRSGRNYRLDFVLQPFGGQRVAIEVDGTDKAAGDWTVDEVQRRVDKRRADLRAAGWRILNLSNDRVVTRSTECITEIEAELHDACGSSPSNPTLSSSPAQSPGALTPTAKSSRVRWLAASAVAAGVSGVAWVAFLGFAPDPIHIKPEGHECPASAPIKGNISDDGEKIYHERTWRYYEAAWPEDCFASPEDASQAGYRQSAVR